MKYIISIFCYVAITALGLFNLYYLWQFANLLAASGFTAMELPIYIAKFCHNVVIIVVLSVIVSITEIE